MTILEQITQDCETKFTKPKNSVTSSIASSKRKPKQNTILPDIFEESEEESINNSQKDQVMEEQDQDDQSINLSELVKEVSNIIEEEKNQEALHDSQNQSISSISRSVLEALVSEELNEDWQREYPINQDDYEDTFIMRQIKEELNKINQ
ncbi:hypothetical protein OXYTRIMIC_034 [Oxytricha trifallax]|uniref:Uncharacterized protein n=1 Tax=Oxytricha trifallax TaxID=1172189 RepID=A0A073IAE1_9SPIT|nr:hypothetical protein OXYTRIMIC_034 [Oxytricha trifallax]